MKIILPNRYYKEVIHLALPVVIANVGQMVVQLADTLMVGRLGSVQLASASFASMVISIIMVFGMGIAMGQTPIVGYSFVSKRYRDCSILLQNGLIQNFVIGVIMVLVCMGIVPFFHLFGQPAEVTAGAIGYYRYVAMSLLPYMVFLGFKHFMDGVGNTKISMVITLVTNLLNVALNYLLIYGKFGFPAMGIEGAAIATLISRVVAPIIYYIYLVQARFYRNFLKFFAINNLSIRSNVQILTIGLPIAAQMLIEFTALAFVGIMMGWIGTDEIAANHIVHTSISLFYLVSNGISSAVTILVSHNYALRAKQMIVRYTIAGSHLATIAMSIAGVILFCCGSVIAFFFVPEIDVVECAVSMFYVVAFMEVFDGLQITALGALRGMGDVMKPMYIATLCYGVLSLGIGYYFGIYLGYGAPALWLGFAIGVTIAFFLFILRIRWKLRVL